MRWIVVSASLALAGCGGLERHQYPATMQDAVTVGHVTHVQPFEGEISEDEWSRAAWGTLAAGVVAGAAAGLSEPGSHSFDAYSYLIDPTSTVSEPRIFNAFDEMNVGDCVAVYKSVREGMHSLSKLPSERCSNTEL